MVSFTSFEVALYRAVDPDVDEYQNGIGFGLAVVVIVPLYAGVYQ